MLKHDNRSRKTGTSQTQHRRYRTDKRKHRNRLSYGRRSERLPLNPNHARNHEHRTTQPTQSIWRRTGSHPWSRRNEWSYKESRSVISRDAKLVRPAAIREFSEPENSQGDNRSRNMGRNRWKS